VTFENIHNYYEKLVLEEILEKIRKNEITNSDDFLADIACVALNQLPARYVRHNVDMVFYMTAEERENNFIQVRNAVIMAIDYVKKHHKIERS
jgi:hypothetical protein